MLRLQIAPASHEDVFIDRYERLLAWALQLTGGAEAQAEDLVHDAFVHFSLQKPNLSAIENLDAYLYRVLRNLQVSQARRAAAAQKSTLRLSDYDSAQLGLHAAPADDRTRAEGELRAICEYACGRKAESKTASALILRFFHGYYPSEIMKISRTPGQAVDKMLWIARREIREHIEPERIHQGAPSADIISELRQRIFASRDTPCPSRREWREVYRNASGGPVETALLAHLVRCRQCLATVNQLLGLKPLDDRDPPEMLGSGDRPKRIRRESERRTSDTVAHKPKELHILVNGFETFSQEISSPVTHFHLAMNGEERPGFVEVISEQSVRLLFLALDPPPDGPVEQRAAASFDSERRLEVSVQFQAVRPILELRYAEPPAPLFDDLDSAPFPRRVRSRDAQGAWFRQPLMFGAAVLLAGIALMFHWLHQPPVSAAAIMDRAIAGEARTEAIPGVAQHRILRFEARKRSPGSSTASAHVEVWRHLRRSLKKVRLLDDQHRLDGVPASAWQTDLSAADFARQVPGETLTARQDLGSIRLLASGGQELRLARSDLHAVERISTDASYIYRLIEEESETLPEAQVPAGVFDAPATLPRNEAPTPRAAANEPGDVEIEVLTLLNSVGALTGEDVSVEAGGPGVTVRAVVESEQRKLELLRVLEPAASDRLRVQIRTVDEAVRESVQSPARVVMRNIEVRSGEVPAYADLRRLLDAEQAHHFADDMLRHSLQARVHARAFQMLNARNAQDPRVRRMLQEHAAAIASETATIRRHLEPIFPPAASTDSMPEEAALYSLVIRQDTVLRAMFSIPSGPPPGRIDTNELWNVIAAVERATSSQ
jgi:DNA-directed RNA polymerase specialized sigma24 family protein